MKVIIIGAGIGGLTLAARLKQKAKNIEVVLYERDDAAFSRSQGYALGLKGDGGLPVLDELGLRKEVLGSDALKVTNFVFTNQAGGELLALPARDEKHLTYRVQRGHLREVLLKAVGDTPINFDKTATGYSQTKEAVTVTFDDGSSATADYVVGSDGVASAIRQQMIGDAKNYLGLCAIVGFAPIDVEHPLLEGGYFMTLGDNGGSMFVYRQPGGVHFSYTLHVSDEAGLAKLPKNELLRRVIDGTQGWHQLIQTIVAATDVDTLLVRGYYDKQPVSRVHDGNVWLLGDAAHPMCPFQGQGANMAMVDGLKIADYLALQPHSSVEVTAALETDIVKRGRKAVFESRNAAKQFHVTSGFKRFNRNLGFKMANFFIRLGSGKVSHE